MATVLLSTQLQLEYAMPEYLNIDEQFLWPPRLVLPLNNTISPLPSLLYDTLDSVGAAIGSVLLLTATLL
jgi:hypothetical protein